MKEKQPPILRRILTILATAVANANKCYSEAISRTSDGAGNPILPDGPMSQDPYPADPMERVCGYIRPLARSMPTLEGPIRVSVYGHRTPSTNTGNTEQSIARCQKQVTRDRLPNSFGGDVVRAFHGANEDICAEEESQE